MVSDNTWYVAITESCGLYSSFVGAGSTYYSEFEKYGRKNGIRVLAEEFDITDPEINRIEGFDHAGKKVRESELALLVQKLREGQEMDCKKELSAIVQNARARVKSA